MFSFNSRMIARRALGHTMSTRAAAAAPKGEVVSFLTLNNLADNPGAVKKVSFVYNTTEIIYISMYQRFSSFSYVLETPSR